MTNPGRVWTEEGAGKRCWEGGLVRAVASTRGILCRVPHYTEMARWSASNLTYSHNYRLSEGGDVGGRGGEGEVAGGG